MLISKKCSRCSLLLPIQDFAKNKHAKSGFRSACRSCSKFKVGKKIKITPFEKKCSKCNLILSISNFQKQEKGRDGFRSYCRNCSRLFSATHREKNSVNEKAVSELLNRIEREKFIENNPDKKYCAKGNHFPSRDLFSKLSSAQDGLQRTCKDCKAIFREKNREKINAQKKIYRQSNLEKVRKQLRTTWAKNKKRYNERQKDYRIKNLAKVREMGREYYKNNVEKCKLNSKFAGIRRRARLKKIKGTFTPQQWQNKLNYFGNRCYLCGDSLENKTIHKEHRIPLSRGGSNFISNVAPACKSCNLSKNTKTEKEFKEWKKAITRL